MPGFVEGRLLQRRMPCRKRPSSPLPVHPDGPVVHDLPARDVMADEIDQLAGGARKYLLERLEYQHVDQQVIHGCEIAGERHIVQIRVCFGRPEGGVDQLTILLGKRGSPGFELGLQGQELALRQLVTEPREPQCDRNTTWASISPKVWPQK
jgi:hypothetical protein